MVTLEFKEDFEGSFSKNNQTIAIGKDYFLPYDFTFAALGSCLYATFLDELEVLNVKVYDANITVDGVKRSSVPTTLEEVTIVCKCCSKDDPNIVKEAFHLACLHCSMFQMIKHVADMFADIEVICK